MGLPTSEYLEYALWIVEYKNILEHAMNYFLQVLQKQFKSEYSIRIKLDPYLLLHNIIIYFFLLVWKKLHLFNYYLDMGPHVKNNWERFNNNNIALPGKFIFKNISKFVLRNLEKLATGISKLSIMLTQHLENICCTIKYSTICLPYSTIHYQQLTKA